MNVNFTMLWIGFFSLSSLTNTDKDVCSKAHSSASYALFHSKKSLKADNFDHQRYYAERAVEALEKTEGMIGECGCEKAKEVITDGLDNLEKAAYAPDWEKGRYYAKKGYADMQNLMGFLEECTSGDVMSYPDEKDFSQVNENVLEHNERSLALEQEKLKAEQQRLEEEKKLLEKQLADQKALKKKLEVARKLELSEQVKVKQKAEDALQAFENSIVQLTNALDCEEAYKVIKNSYIRNETVLEKESLKGTKNYYLRKAQEIAQKALNDLSHCSNY